MQLLQTTSPHGSDPLSTGLSSDTFYYQIFKNFEMLFAMKWIKVLFSAYAKQDARFSASFNASSLNRVCTPIIRSKEPIKSRNFICKLTKSLTTILSENLFFSRSIHPPKYYKAGFISNSVRIWLIFHALLRAPFAFLRCGWFLKNRLFSFDTNPVFFLFFHSAQIT